MNLDSFPVVPFSAGVLLYVFFAFCLVKIAEKLNLEKTWWGWIPILQIILMLKAAQKPWWWIFLLLIPFLNIVVGLIIWFKIAQNLGKSGWLGLLMVVPVVDLFVLAYFAFSK